MEKYLELKKIFEENKNEDAAIKMSNYMRNIFIFYGIPSSERRRLYSSFIKEEKKNKVIDWKLLDECYRDEHREFQYFVYDYLLTMRKYISYSDIEKIKEYIVTKSWWDTIDFLCKVIGNISKNDRRVKYLMIDWSLSDNIWIKRTAIEHQLGLEVVDEEALEKIIVNCFGSDEFFINKAIGWSLRDYSKSNPMWVKSFIEKYKDRMHMLSIKEASKYLG